MYVLFVLSDFRLTRSNGVKLKEVSVDQLYSCRGSASGVETRGNLYKLVPVCKNIIEV